MRAILIIGSLALLLVGYYSLGGSPRPRSSQLAPTDTVPQEGRELEPDWGNEPEAAAPVTSEASVVATNVNVRSGPSTTQPLVGTAQLGEHAEILEASQGWTRVRLASGTVGWISSEYLSEQQAEFPDASVPPTPSLARQSELFSLYKEEIEDTPIKTQIVQHVVVNNIPSRAAIETELGERYERIIVRSGFDFHPRPTNVYIYVYASEEQATAEQGLWIGMLAMSPLNGGQPDITINDTRFAALSAPPEERFGLSENERRQVFYELAAAEDRAREEAMNSVPDTRIMEQLELERTLADQYRGELLERWGITEDELGPIKVEAFEEGWIAP